MVLPDIAALVDTSAHNCDALSLIWHIASITPTRHFGSSGVRSGHRVRGLSNPVPIHHSGVDNAESRPRRPSIPASPTTSCASASTTNSIQTKSGAFTDRTFVPTTSNAVPTWKTQVVALLERNKRYPEAAQSRREQGVAQVFFSLDRQGRVQPRRALIGASALDEEALALLRRAQPFPPPPRELPGKRVDLTVPIRFNLK